MTLTAAQLNTNVGVTGVASARSQLLSMGQATSTAEKGFGSLGKAASGIGGALGHAKSQLTGLISGPLGMIGLGAGLFGIAGGLEATVNASRSFGQSMELIYTQAHASQAEVDSMSQSVLGLSGQVATSPNDLAAGLYHLESAGFRGATALNALKIAAEGAKIGNANLEDVTNALDAVLVAGGPDADNLAGSMGELNAIVGAGDMHMQDLADAMGTGILGVAHTFGLSLKDIGAALATFGDLNIRGSEAATKLRQAIVMLGAPSQAGAKALASIKLSSTQLADDMRNKGLVAALTDLKQHLEASGLTASQQAQVLSRAFGGGKTVAGILTLLDQLDRVKSKEEDIGAGATKFADDWAATQATAQYKWDQFNTALSTTGIIIGNEVLPVLTDAVSGLGEWVTEHESDIQGFFHDLAQDARSFGGFLAGTVLPTLAGIGSTLLNAWDTVPPDLRDLLVKGFLVDRAVKWTFGISATDVAKAGLGLAAGFLSGIAGKAAAAVTGGIVGSLKPVPVLVMNWPPGALAGGLGGGAATGAEAGGAAAVAGGVGLGTIVASVLGSAVVGAAIIALENQLFGITPADVAKANSSGQFGPRTPAQAAQVAGLTLTPEQLADVKGAPSTFGPIPGIGAALGEHAGISAADEAADNLAGSLDDASSAAKTWAGSWTKSLQDAEKANHNLIFHPATAASKLLPAADTTTKYLLSLSSGYFKNPQAITNLEHTIKGLQADEAAATKRGDKKTADALDDDIKALQTLDATLTDPNATMNSLLGKINDGQSTLNSNITTGNSAIVAQVNDDVEANRSQLAKKLSANVDVTVTPQKVNVNVDGRTLAYATIKYFPHGTARPGVS